MYYFLIYDDETHTSYLNQLIKSIHQYGSEFNIIKFHKNDIDIEFKLKNNHILTLERGGGYWLWKPYIINEVMNQINHGDIIYYLDSKYYFIEPFKKLLYKLRLNDIIVWKNKPNEQVWYMKNWCKMDVILKYNMYDTVFHKNAEDCWAGSIIIRKTTKTSQYIKEWLYMCSYENITDSPSISTNSEFFSEHRHDQSLLSIIIHKYNIPLHYFEKRYLQNSRSPY